MDALQLETIRVLSSVQPANTTANFFPCGERGDLLMLTPTEKVTALFFESAAPERQQQRGPDYHHYDKDDSLGALYWNTYLQIPFHYMQFLVAFCRSYLFHTSFNLPLLQSFIPSGPTCRHKISCYRESHRLLQPSTDVEAFWKSPCQSCWISHQRWSCNSQSHCHLLLARGRGSLAWHRAPGMGSRGTRRAAKAAPVPPGQDCLPPQHISVSHPGFYWHQKALLIFTLILWKISGKWKTNKEQESSLRMSKLGRLFDQENKSVSFIGRDIWDGTEQPFSQFQKFSFWSVTMDATITFGYSHPISQLLPDPPLHDQTARTTAKWLPQLHWAASPCAWIQPCAPELPGFRLGLPTAPNTHL